MNYYIEMKRNTAFIEIGNFDYSGVVDLQINSSSELLTDTAIIKFPRKTSWDKKEITELIKRNDTVNIKIGYDNNNDDVFTGIVKSVKSDIPFTVSVEDLMFKLKKNSIKKSFKKVTLDELLKTILPSDIKYKVNDINLGKFRINNTTPAVVLNHLKQSNNYGIYSYFKGDTLYSGLRYWSETQKSHTFSFTTDIISYDNLEFRIAQDTRFKVVVISIADDNSKTTVEKGDKDGEQRTYHYYNIDKKELERRAEQELEKLKYDGYAGSFVAFGQPVVNHGDAVTLINHKYNPQGTYIVKSVQREFGQNGYKQTIELDRVWK